MLAVMELLPWRMRLSSPPSYRVRTMTTPLLSPLTSAAITILNTPALIIPFSTSCHLSSSLYHISPRPG